MVLLKYLPSRLNDLHFERLSDVFASILDDFQSYQNDLRNFLVDDALRAQDISISTTFLVFDAIQWAEFNKTGQLNILNLLGYVTLLSDSIRLDADLKDQFRMRGIEYKSLPAMKIGRLCVDDRYIRRNIGSCIITWSALKAERLNRDIACRFMILDAKRHGEPMKDSYHFYKRLGFKILKRKDRPDIDLIKQTSGHTLMYIDLYHAIEAMRNSQQNL